MVERRACDIIRSTEEVLAGMFERPLTVSDALRLLRTLNHLADARETLCPEIRSEEALPEPLKSSFCSFLNRFLEAAVSEVEREGRITRPDEFTSTVYYVDKLKKTYSCR